MSKRIYNKPPKSFKDQLQQLKDRNLTVDDDVKALEYLSHISYYRLSAYFLPYYQQTKNYFSKGTTFKQIIDTYSFDRELRLLIFDFIERIEVAIRTQFVYCMAMHYNDSHWQDNKQLFITLYNNIGNRIDTYLDLQNIISRAKRAKTSEVFIKHYMEQYNKPANPPSWMCFELLTIGELSRVFRGLRAKDDKKRIAKKFDLHLKIFTSWLNSLNYVRNICAHHARLWNRDLAVNPKRLLKPFGNWVSSAYNDNNQRVFYFLCLLKYFLTRVNPNNHLKEKLVALFNKYPNVPIKHIGIPSDINGSLLDWQNEPLWQN